MSIEDLHDLGPVGLMSRFTDTGTPEEARVLAGRYEAGSFPCVWIPEGLGHEALTHASVLLHATTKLAVATGIASIWARDPLATHSGTKLLRAAHDDRFVLGLGVSHRLVVDSLRGHAYQKPLEAMGGYLGQLEGLDQANGNRAPRVIAALGPKMLELAAAHEVGVLTYLTNASHTSDARARMGTGHISAEIPVVIASPDKARASARKHLATYLSFENYVASFRRLGFADEDFADNGSDRLIDGLVAHGSVDDVRAAVLERRQAGADHVALQPLDRATLDSLLEAGASAFA